MYKAWIIILQKFFVEVVGISAAYLGFRGPQVQTSVQKPATLKQVIRRFFTASRQVTNIASNKDTIVAFHFLLRKLYCAENLLFLLRT